jgi:hypothetical protein
MISLKKAAEIGPVVATWRRPSTPSKNFASGMPKVRFAASQSLYFAGFGTIFGNAVDCATTKVSHRCASSFHSGG